MVIKFDRSLAVSISSFIVFLQFLMFYLGGVSGKSLNERDNFSYLLSTGLAISDVPMLDTRFRSTVACSYCFR